MRNDLNYKVAFVVCSFCAHGAALYEHEDLLCRMPMKWWIGVCFQYRQETFVIFFTENLIRPTPDDRVLF